MFENKMPRYEILSEDAMASLETAWRRLMTEVGVEFMHEDALKLFRDAGQKVVDNTVFLDPEWVLGQVAKAPKEFDVQARNPANNVHIGGNKMVFSGVYGPPFVREGTVRRDAMMDDFRNFTKLAQTYDELDSAGGIICEPYDTPLDSRHLDMTYALQTLTDKFYMGNVVSGVNARDTIAMGEILFGGREAIEKTPVSISLINCNSPLKWDDRMLESLFEYCAAGQPVVLTPFILMGAMSPVTIPAALVQQITEALSGIALTQLVRPGTPVIFGSFLSNTLAFGAHVEVGHGGHFLGSMHTMERFRTCFHRPFLSSSDNFDKWTRNGSLDTNQRAGVIYKKKLEEYEAPVMDAAIKEELERYVIRRRAELGD